MSEYTTQYSRISHHTVALSATTLFTGSTFTVPGSESIDENWSIYDLALSEIGVDEFRDKAYIRIGSNIKEINLGTGTTVTPPTTPTLTQVLTAGNTTGGQDIEVSTGDLIKNQNLGFIDLNYFAGGQIRISNNGTSAGYISIDNDIITMSVTPSGQTNIFNGKTTISTFLESNFRFNNYAFKTLSLPFWNLSVGGTVVLGHGLSATEWKTISNLTGFFRNDADTLYNSFSLSVGTIITGSTTSPYIEKWESSFITIESGNALNGNSDYSGNTFSRGKIRFQYIPD